MPIVRKTADFTGANPNFAVSDPWPAESTVGYSKLAGSDNGTIILVAQKGYRLSSGVTSVTLDDTNLTGRYRTAEVKFPNFSNSNLVGPALIDHSTQDGITAVSSSSAPTIRLFEVINGQMLTTPLWTSAGNHYATNLALRLVFDDVDKKYRVYANGTQVLNASSQEYTNTTHTPTRAAVLSRFGYAAELSSEYEPAFSIDTFTNPLIPGGAAAGSHTGFSEGSITANFGGLAFTGTVVGGNLSGTLAGLTDGGLCPFLPAAAINGTFTQGANSSPAISRPISVPFGLRELRDGAGNPANFANIVTGNSKYLGKPFADAGYPLTTLDRLYWDPASGLLFDQDGRIRINAPDHATNPVPSLPYTTTIRLHRGADGRVYFHTIEISDADTGVPGEVTVHFLSAGFLSSKFLSCSFLEAEGLA